MPRLGEKSRPCNPIKQSIKLFAFTTEAQRSQRENFFVCRGGADRQKVSVSNKSPLPEGGRFKEDRYLPILLENIPLSVLPAYRQISNEYGFQCKLPEAPAVCLPRLNGRQGASLDRNDRRLEKALHPVLKQRRWIHSILVRQGNDRFLLFSVDEMQQYPGVPPMVAQDLL